MLTLIHAILTPIFGLQEAGDEYIDLSEFMSVLQTGEHNNLELYDRRLVDWGGEPSQGTGGSGGVGG